MVVSRSIPLDMHLFFFLHCIASGFLILAHTRYIPLAFFHFCISIILYILDSDFSTFKLAILPKIWTFPPTKLVIRPSIYNLIFLALVDAQSLYIKTRSLHTASCICLPYTRPNSYINQNRSLPTSLHPYNLILPSQFVPVAKVKGCLWFSLMMTFVMFPHNIEHDSRIHRID